MKTKVGTTAKNTQRREKGERLQGEWPLLVTASAGDERAFGPIDDDWAYEMRLLQQNGRWVVAELRVFPRSGEPESIRDLKTRTEIRTGAPADAAKAARALSHLALGRSQPERVPPGGLTAGHLRRISFQRGTGRDALNKLSALCLKFAQNQKARERSERRLKTLEEQYDRRRSYLVRLAGIAACYVEAIRSGSRAHNVEVARRLHMTDAEVRDAIHQARRNGLLSPTSNRGVSGGELTALAHEALKEGGLSLEWAVRQGGRK